MFELGGERKLPTTLMSFIIRAAIFLAASAGWAMWAFQRFNPTEGTDPFVWVLAVSACIALPMLWLTNRIEQYYCHAIWGIGFGRAVNYWLSTQPEEVKQSFIHMGRMTSVENSAVRQAMDAPAEKNDEASEE